MALSPDARVHRGNMRYARAHDDFDENDIEDIEELESVAGAAAPT